MRPRAHKNAWTGPARVAALALVAGAVARAPLAFPQTRPPAQSALPVVPGSASPAQASPPTPAAVSSGGAQTELAAADLGRDPSVVPIRLLAGDDGLWRLDALTTVSLALRVRTSIDAAPRASLVPPEAGAIFATPLLFWSAREAADASGEAQLALAQYLAHGGLLVVDGDPAQDAAFLAQAEQTISAALPAGSTLAPLGSGDILLHTFYLLRAPPGDVRVARIGSEIRVVFSRTNALGRIGRGDDDSRESATRLLINVVMYALCLDYKDDQVHAPFLMRRRRGAP